jgi:hypothetical protein
MFMSPSGLRSNRKMAGETPRQPYKTETMTPFCTSAMPVGPNMTVPIFAQNYHLPLVTIDFRLMVTGIRRPAVLRLSRQ